MSNKRKNSPFLILCIVFGVLNIVFPVYASEVEVISLERALRIALEKNPSLIVSRNEVNAAQARMSQAAAVYYPQLNASAGANRTWNNQVSSSSNDNSEKLINNYSTGLSVTQYLYDFGKTQAEIEQSNRLFESSEKDLETVEKKLIREVKAAYFDVLKNQQLTIVARENMEVRQKQLKQAQAMYRQGLNPRIDVTRGEVEVSQARLNLVTMEYGHKEAIIAFENFLGGPPVSGEYRLADKKPQFISCLSLEKMIQAAIDNRPELVGLINQVEAAKADLLSARKSSYPSFEAKGTYTYDGDSLPMEDQRWQAGIYLSWPIFTGFRQTGVVAESKAGVNRGLAQIDEIRLLITKEVSLAYLSLQSTWEMIQNALIVFEHAKENVTIAQGRYQTGVSDFIELSDAQLLFSQSRSGLIQAEYDYLKALAVLEFAIGAPLTGEQTDK